MDIELGGKNLRVMNSHWLSQKGEAIDKRLFTAQQVANAVAGWKLENPNLDVVLVGDLNVALEHIYAEDAPESQLVSALGLLDQEPLNAQTSGFYDTWFEMWTVATVASTVVTVVH